MSSPLLAKEDPRLLRGEATYTADVSLPGMVHLEFVGSTEAHAKIKRIDTAAALAMPGVLAVVTGADLDGKLMPLPCIWIPGGTDSHFPPHPYGLPGARPVLAVDRVRHMGDPVAAVVAETPRQACAAALAVEVDYEPLPVVTTPMAALADGAPQLHDTVPGNLNALWTCGDRDGTDKAITDAEVVVEFDLVNQRTINSPIEPRAAVGGYDPATEEFTLYSTSQSPHNHRFLLAALVLGIPFNKLRVISSTVGGSFGTKGYLYPDMPLVLHLARELGRPVKWVDTRTGLMTSTVQGRDQHQHVTIAGARDGTITGLRCTAYANLGGYPSTIGPGVATALMGRSISGMYAIPHAFCEVYAAFTNVVPLGAQRGSGRSEATFLVERAVDQFAAKVGMDPAVVRQRNLVPANAFPYDNGLGWTYDSGDYPTALALALDKAGYDKVAEARADAATRGKRLGVGIGCYVAICGVGPSTRMSKEGMLGGTWESANVRMHPTGEVTVLIGSASTGQSHETTFGQIAADVLGVDSSMVQVRHSDTSKAPYGQGTYGSRSYSVGGPAVQAAALKVKDKIITMAAHMFGVERAEVRYDNGKVYVADDEEKVKSVSDMAMAVWYGWDMPPGMEPALDETVHFDPPDFNYPFGAHVAYVEVDEDTGAVDVVRYIAVDDNGVIGNELVVTGQVEGSIMHGLGQVLMEAADYDERGHLVNNDLSRYPIPRATDAPVFELYRTVTPCPHNALGAKGAGETATVPVTAAVTNAVCDALGVANVEMPLTPEKVWRILHPQSDVEEAR